MITNGFKNLMKQVLSSGGNSEGLLPIKDVGGTIRYLADYTAYPYTVNTGFSLVAANAGISVGSGNTASTDGTYQLETTITSGLSGSVTVSKTVDQNDNSSIILELSLTNTSGSDITIKEIGYKQTFSASATQSGTTTDDYVFLIDRTVLSSPLTIAASGTALIQYTLTTKYGSSNGVQDVEVDGVSVVNQSGVAEIDSSDFGTKVEANPATGTSVGDLTSIKIAGAKYDIPSGGGSSHAYSTSEQVVDTWIDGSDIYERTWVLNTAVAIGTNWSDVREIVVQNLDKMIYAEGYNLTLGYCYPLIGAMDSGFFQGVSALNFDNTVEAITLRYTKTS